MAVSYTHLTLPTSWRSRPSCCAEPCFASSFTDFFANGTSPIRTFHPYLFDASYAFSTVNSPMSTQKLSGLMSWPSARSKFVLCAVRERCESEAEA